MSFIYSFFQLISKCRIEIPIIQRDYAQGRVNPKANDVRKAIVSDLIKAVKDDNETLFFDFVYGRLDNYKFIPFDGQQRLTTLFLFHKYIFEKYLSNSNCRYKDNCFCKEILKNFTYATRQSSREFCTEMVEKEIIPTKENEKVSSHVINQSWFYSDWEKDPTIMGMLVMLDEIHSQFKNTNIEDYKSFAEKLTSGSNCPITFYFVDMGGNRLPDETYVKMNARGKTLTPFENFKASLEQYLHNTDKELINRLNSNIDGKWLDLFWNVINIGKEEKELPDSAMMSFFNRHFMNVWRCWYAQNSKSKSEAEEEIEEYEPLNKRIIKEMPLYPSKDNFVSWDIYQYILDKCGVKECLNPIFNIWDKLCEDNSIRKECQAVWNRGDVEIKWNLFEGERNNDNREKYPSRIAFYALLKYFGETSYSSLTLSRWMRVVWNIIENSTIDSSEPYHAALRLINKLSTKCSTIYDALTNHFGDFGLGDRFYAQEQVKEECTKATQILNGSQRTDGESWEKTIEKAESYSFFKGAIRFLFTNDTGEKEDWDNFDKKWKNAQLYFDEKGVAEWYKNNAILLRYYISEFKEWGEFWEFDYDNKPSTWKHLLLSYRYKANHIILMNLLEKDHDFSSFISSLDKYDKEYKELQEMVQNELVKTNILVKSSESSMKLHWRYNSYSLYPYNTKTQKKIYVIANKRNQILSQLFRRDGFNTNNRIEDCDFFWGWDIPFEYSFKNISYKFQWDIDGKIYLMENGHYKEPKEKYSINVNGIEDANTLIQKMDELINPKYTNE